MKNEKDMMADKEKWIVETATTIENKIFERLEKCIEQSEWEYWEKSFIPIDYKNIEAIAQEVFEERKDKSFAEKYRILPIRCGKRHCGALRKNLKLVAGRWAVILIMYLELVLRNPISFR